MRWAAALRFPASLRIFLYSFEGSRSAAVAVFADECVDGGVFAELVDAGGKDDEFGVVGERHAGAVDGFVAEPCAFELVRVEEGRLLS